jgi:betaine-aldehyde dehydrogenase
MRIGREEVFGPLMCVLPWSDYETVLELANGVDLGVSASVWSDNIHLELAAARCLQAGYAWVNATNPHYLGAPYAA